MFGIEGKYLLIAYRELVSDLKIIITNLYLSMLRII